LDPAERVRFHNLLSEIGENIVVILSTHIVEDVSDLCSQMAVISRGQVLLTGEPGRTIDQLRGKVWRKMIARPELKDYETQYVVISSHLVAGKTVIHVLNDQQPDHSFSEVSPDLEDVYFSTLKKSA
jgi:ABC-2 type transport system ATP-binding protein